MLPLARATSASLRLEGDVVIKRLRSSRARDQEVHGLTAWGAHLVSLDTPEVLPPLPGDDRRTLRLRLLPGCALVEVPHWRERLDVAERLGAGLVELHGLPCPNDPLPLDQALARRMSGWLGRDRGALPAALRSEVERAFDPSPLALVDRTPTHRDVHEGNVLVHEGRLALLDWEHARADCPWFDVVRTWGGTPAEDDAWTLTLARAAGLDPIGDRDALRAVGLLEGVGSIVWGVQHGQAAQAERGESLLERLFRAW